MAIVSYSLMVDTVTNLVDRVLHCTRGQYTCGDGSCILDSFVLDGEPDCPGGEDEDVSRLPCLKLNRGDCNRQYYETMKIRTDMRHAGQIKFRFNADPKDSAEPIHFGLPDNSTKVDIVEKQQDISLNTSKGLVNNLTIACLEKGFLPCQLCQPQCFPLHGLCVYDHDIQGYLRYCQIGSHLADCRSVGCPGKFKCPGSYCVPIRRLCDDVWDGPGQEDENPDMCRKHNRVYLGCFHCNGGLCLDQSEVCDGHPDCGLTAEDESRCRVPDCPSGCKCLWENMICMVWIWIKLSNPYCWGHTIIYTTCIIYYLHDHQKHE